MWIDDASHISYAEVLNDEKACTAVAFLERAIAWFRTQGVEIQRLLPDNGSCYVSRIFAKTCKAPT